MKPNILKPGDSVAVISPSQSFATIDAKHRELALERFSELGINVIFGKHIDEIDEFDSSNVQSRIADLHDAFQDPNIKAIFAVRGGWNASQLLPYIDWDTIKASPKIFCGYSNITTLHCAIYAQAGLITYYGPGYSSFGLGYHSDYTIDYFKKCFMSEEGFEVIPSREWSDNSLKDDDGNRVIHENNGFEVVNDGQATGKILGGCFSDFSLLYGTGYMPDMTGSILFLEDDIATDPKVLDRLIQSLTFQPSFKGVKGIVFGRFQNSSNINQEVLSKIIKSKPEFNDIPIISNADFGHTDPKFPFPIGGTAHIKTDPVSIIIGG